MLSFVYSHRITHTCRFINSHRKTDVCPVMGYTEYVAMSDNRRASNGDRRMRRTRASLQRALIELVAEQDLSEIGVADVVDRADVSRSTFYDHYQDVHELAEVPCATLIPDPPGP